ncbi:hypothetical protein [Brevibacillus migulae]|uniref:hypothetical protein n=1 Tax=Brevibacillus migulae TaxID=1644114 RepID=UPI00106E0F4B|nr:hypothetical protein [Brevibacillus migulae]
MDFKIFQVGEDYSTYIVAQTKEEALEYHNSMVDAEWHETLEGVTEVPLDKKGRFEAEEGYQDLTFGEFLGSDFVYEKPVVICWNE